MMLEKPLLVAWRTSNRAWSRWHVQIESGVTVCGRDIPVETRYSKPTVAPYEGPRSARKIANACRTCRERYAFTQTGNL